MRWLAWRWDLARIRRRRRRFVRDVGGRPTTEGDLLLYASLRAIEYRLEANRP